MRYEELVDGIPLDRSEVERLLSAHDGEPWHCDEKTFTDDDGEVIAAPSLVGEYDSAAVMAWLGY